MYTLNVWGFLIEIYRRPTGKNYGLALPLLGIRYLFPTYTTVFRFKTKKKSFTRNDF